MREPYRDALLPCPACQQSLRVEGERLGCDACGGVMLTQAEVAAELHALTSITPEISVVVEAGGERLCPRCAGRMEVCKLSVRLIETTVTTKKTLDQCSHHGLWFDREELEHVEAQIERQGKREWRTRSRSGWWRTSLFALR